MRLSKNPFIGGLLCLVFIFCIVSVLNEFRTTEAKSDQERVQTIAEDLRKMMRAARAKNTPAVLTEKDLKDRIAMFDRELYLNLPLADLEIKNVSGKWLIGRDLSEESVSVRSFIRHRGLSGIERPLLTADGNAYDGGPAVFIPLEDLPGR